MTSSPARMTDLWSTRPAVGEATNVGSESTRRFDIGPADRRNRPVPANAASDGRRQELPRYQPLMAGLNLIEHQGFVRLYTRGLG
jgi:hypothetical protein